MTSQHVENDTFMSNNLHYFGVKLRVPSRAIDFPSVSILVGKSNQSYTAGLCGNSRFACFPVFRVYFGASGH